MKVITSKIEWIVPNVGNILRSIYSTNKIQLASNRFCNSDFPKVAWNLCIELSSIDVAGRHSISREDYDFIYIWLCQMGPNGLNELVNTKYKIYAVVDGINVDIAKSTHKFENQEKLGFTKVPSLKLLKNEDIIFLHCEVEIDCYNSNDNLQNIYSNILEQEIFTDFVVKIGDQIINTHRCILAQNSEVFFNMFKKNGMIEAQNSEVTISDTSPECFRAMLEFFYTGKITKSTFEKYVEDIFAIANKYQVESLKYECELLMSSKIEVNNIIKYCNIIQLYGAPTLEEACKNFIKVNAQINSKYFSNSEEWNEIKNNFPQFAIRTLEYVVSDSNK